jgi:hypothetical protein
MLGQAHDAIARYRGRDDLVSLRCLARAYVADGRWPEAKATIARAPDDAFMLEQQAEMSRAPAARRRHSRPGNARSRPIPSRLAGITCVRSCSHGSVGARRRSPSGKRSSSGRASAVLNTTPSGPSRRSPGCGHQDRSEHRRLAALDADVEAEEQKRPGQDGCDRTQHLADRAERVKVVVNRRDDDAHDDPDDGHKSHAVPEHSVRPSRLGEAANRGGTGMPVV